MDQEQAIEIAKAYAAEVRNHMLIKKVVLFGSQLNGMSKLDSDIDIAIIVEEIQGDYLTIGAKLFKLRRGIDDRIEPILLEENNDQSGFLHDIIQTGRIIYDANETLTH